MIRPVWLASLQWSGGHCELGPVEAETYELALGEARGKLAAAVVMVRRQDVAPPDWERRKRLLDPTDLSGGGFSRYHQTKTPPAQIEDHDAKEEDGDD